MKNLIFVLILLPICLFSQQSYPYESDTINYYDVGSSAPVAVEFFPRYFRVASAIRLVEDDRFIIQGCCNALTGEGIHNGAIRCCNVEISDCNNVTLIDCQNVYISDTQNQVLSGEKNKRCWGETFLGIKYLKCVDIPEIGGQCCGCMVP